MLNQKGEVADVERAEMSGRRVAAGNRTGRRRGTARGKRVQFGNRPPVGGLALRGRLGAFDRYGVRHAEVNRIAVVVDGRFERCRLSVRLRGVAPVIVMVVMTAGAVTVTVRGVAFNGDRSRVDVRSLVVPGGLAAVCVPEGGG